MATSAAVKSERIETRVEVLEHQTTELRSRVDRGFEDVSKQLSRLTETLSNRREPADWTALGRTIATTVVIVTALFTFLDHRYTLRGERAAENAVLKYRVELLEKAGRRPSGPALSIIPHVAQR